MSGLRGKIVWPGGQVEASSLDLEEVQSRLDAGESLTIEEQKDLVSALKLEMDRTKYADEYINGAQATPSESEDGGAE
jgi:hypothetical protein